MTPKQEISKLKSDLEAEKKRNKKICSRVDTVFKLNLTIVLLDVYRSMMNYQSLPALVMLVDAITHYIGGADKTGLLSEEYRKEQTEKLEYVAKILHYYYCLAHPEFLYDSPLKNFDKDENSDLTQLLDLTLNNFTLDNKTILKCPKIKDNIEKELNKELPPYSIQLWVSKCLPYKSEYQKYFLSLYKNILILYQRANLVIDERFMIVKKVMTTHNRYVLNDIFNIISEKKLVEGNETVRSQFLSIFSTSVNANEEKIEWKGMNEKNKGVSFQALYIIFKYLYLFDNTYDFEQQKSTIANFFYYLSVGRQCPVTSEKIRMRGKISKENIELKDKIIDILTSYYGKRCI